MKSLWPAHPRAKSCPILLHRASGPILEGISGKQRHPSDVTSSVSPGRMQQRGGISSSFHFDVTRAVDCRERRDATNSSLSCSAQPPKRATTRAHKRAASTSLESRRQEVVEARPPPFAREEGPLAAPPPTSLGMNQSASVGSSRHICILGTHMCPKAGWKIQEFCEACHG